MSLRTTDSAVNEYVCEIAVTGEEVLIHKWMGYTQEEWERGKEEIGIIQIQCTLIKFSINLFLKR